MNQSFTTSQKIIGGLVLGGIAFGLYKLFTMPGGPPKAPDTPKLDGVRKRKKRKKK